MTDCQTLDGPPACAEGKLYAVIELVVKKTPMTTPALLTWLSGWTVQVVNKKETYRATKCSWPRRETYVNDYLIHKKKAKDDWITFENVRVFTFCKTLNSAKMLAERLQFTSDVGELSESETLNVKRNRTATNRFNPADSSSDEDDTPLQGLKMRKAPSSAINVSLNSSDSTPDSPDSPDSSFEQPDNRMNSPGDLHSDNSTSAGSSSLHSDVSSANQNALEKVAALGQQHTSEGINARVLAHLSQIRSEVLELRRILLKVYMVTCGPQDGAKEIDDIPSLPLRTEKEFNTFETLCQKEDAKLGMIKYVSEYGSSDLRDTVYNMLKKLLTNELAMQYNVTGINRKGSTIQKKKFANTAPFIVLKAAVKLHVRNRGVTGKENYNAEAFNESVSRWLKDSKKRYETEKKKKEEI